MRGTRRKGEDESNHRASQIAPAYGSEDLRILNLINVDTPDNKPCAI
jgi:hypothetical protein